MRILVITLSKGCGGYLPPLFTMTRVMPYDPGQSCDGNHINALLVGLMPTLQR